MNKYEIIIFWSKEDDAFIAQIPELKGCMAHGDTPDEALREVNIMAEEWLEIAKEKDGKYRSRKEGYSMRKD